MDKIKDELDRRLNDFAKRSFRDTADRDYITARLACRAELMPQFLWSAHQSIEKYLKYILLVNRIPAKVGHDITSALSLTKKLRFKLDIRPRSKEFIEHVAQYGEYRYLDISYFVHGYLLIDLDTAIWDLRRYCQVLYVSDKRLPPNEQKMLYAAQDMLKNSNAHPPQNFRIVGGLLEQILEKKDHPAREAFLWQNAFFGVRKRRHIKAKNYLQAANAPLFLYPQMLDELLKYVFIPKELRAGYKKHIEAISKSE